MSKAKNKHVLEKSIICSSVDNMRKVMDKLHILGYESLNGMPLVNVFAHKIEWDRGIRMINVYNNKSVKFAAGNNTKSKIMLVKDIDF